MRTNQHGLSRHIPEAVKQEVRRNSKHGCVVCRALPYDYEHFDPEFSAAARHDPTGICLLCTRCHGEVTRGRLDKGTVRSAYERVRNSDDIAPPFYDARLAGSLSLGLGDADFSSMPPDACVLEYDGERVLQIGYTPDEVLGGSRPSMTGILQDLRERPLIRFEDNRITYLAEGLDLTLSGKTLTIQSQEEGAVLQVTFDPPSGIRINRLRMKYKDLVCEFDETFGITYPSPRGGWQRCLVSKIKTAGADSAISYHSNPAQWNYGPLRMAGGEGIYLPFSGAVLARGAGQMLIARLVYWNDLPSSSA